MKDAKTFAKEILTNPELLKKIDYSSYAETKLLEEALAYNPDIYFLMDQKNITEGMAIALVKKNPALFADFQANLRTTGVKLAMLEINPSRYELFEKTDVDMESVKFLYTTYPEMLENLEDKKVNAITQKYIKALKKQGIKPAKDEEDEE